jgi:hypothetical protein
MSVAHTERVLVRLVGVLPTSGLIRSAKSPLAISSGETDPTVHGRSR